MMSRCMGQVPSLQGVIPMDGSTGSSKVIQTRLKRCVTHFHIAQNINYHQQFTRMNPFWPAVGGSGPTYGAKPYNLNVVPPTESVALLGNPMQGAYPGRPAPAGLAPASVQEKGPNGAPAFPIHTSKDRSSVAAVSGYMDTAQKKPTMIQQTPPQTGSAANIMHSPAFIFPLNQQQVAVAAARSNAAVKPVTGSGGGSNAVGPSSSASNSTQSSGTVAAAAPASMMNFNYPGLPPTEAQYLAILQNNGYPFTIPPQVGAHPSYRHGNLTQTMPYFSAPLYPPQMLHPSLQQQQPPSSSHAQQPSQIQNNTSTSGGSSSSQKQQQQQKQKQRLQGGVSGSSHGGFPSSKPQQQTTQQQRPHQPQLPQNREHEQPGGGEGPSTADSSRISHIYNQSFPIPIHRQNFALATPATMFPEKQSQQQHEQGLKGGGGGGGAELNPSHQAFALPFNPYGATVTVRPAHQGLDFSQATHPIFQSLPEAAVRHGIQISSTAQQHQQQQQKRPVAEEGKPSNDSEEEQKLGKATYTHSLAFSRSMEGDPHQPHMILGNNVIDSAPTFNLINNSTSNNSNRAVSTSRPSSTVRTLPPATIAATSVIPQQQRINQQQQQQISMHRNKPAVASNIDVHADRVAVVGSSSAMSMCSAVTKFPTGFAQAIIQTNNPNQPIQWKGHSISSMNALQPQNSMVKKLPPPPQQQQQSQQTRAQPVASAQTQISFGVSNSKPMTSPPLSQQLLNHQSPSSAATPVGSPPTSISKSSNAGGGGSPRASTGSKPGPPPLPPPSVVSPVVQPTGKNSVSSSSRKSSPVSSRAMPSILGSAVKPPQQQQQQQHQHQQQSFPAAQLFFSSSYMQAHSPQSSGAAYYHQRRPLDQQQQQQQQQPHPLPSGILIILHLLHFNRVYHLCYLRS
ncbi:Protein TIME FOR COFFEE [Acorus gramineus]|uniref:Protein TIME FOR COFFEE n=1 Tax=Acorus gramineus TaxID=55184 RepID=A0AAV9ASC4_ACOGR|nr:Protein TIME FOR COFFEE [Acorus gramineus]